MTEFESFMQMYKREQDERRTKALTSFAQQAVPSLAAAGVRRVDVAYSGYGDSGAIDDVTCYGDDDEPVVPDSDLIDWLSTTAECLIPAGFENNEGGEGVVKFDLVKGTYHLHHGERVMEVNWSDEEGKF